MEVLQCGVPVPMSKMEGGDNDGNRSNDSKRIKQTNTNKTRRIENDAK